MCSTSAIVINNDGLFLFKKSTGSFLFRYPVEGLPGSCAQ